MSDPSMSDPPMSGPTFPLAARTQALSASAIREILKLTAGGAVLSLAGGLPSPQGFPVAGLDAAWRALMGDARPESGRTEQAPAAGSALQYGPSEGLMALREAIAARLPWPVSPQQVLITTGSQQGLDLLGKVLIDPGSAVLVQRPTYLGALQAFSLYQPRCFGLDETLPPAQALDQACDAAHQAGAGQPRLVYLLPNFRNPTGDTLDAPTRAALAAVAQRRGLLLVEDDPYGALAFDGPPPAPLATHAPQHTVYLGSFSKVLAPGLRVGYMVLPPALFGPVVQAKQAADLHTASLSQHLIARLLERGGTGRQDGHDPSGHPGDWLGRHTPALQALYRRQAQALLEALAAHMPPGVRWTQPQGGMFVWLTLPEGLDASALLPAAIAAGVAYVPGAAFYDSRPDVRTLRLSFVTLDAATLAVAVQRLAGVVRGGLERLGPERTALDRVPV